MFYETELRVFDAIELRVFYARWRVFYARYASVVRQGRGGIGEGRKGKGRDWVLVTGE